MNTSTYYKNRGLLYVVSFLLIVSLVFTGLPMNAFAQDNETPERSSSEITEESAEKSENDNPGNQTAGENEIETSIPDNEEEKIPEKKADVEQNIEIEEEDEIDPALTEDENISEEKEEVNESEGKAEKSSNEEIIVTEEEFESLSSLSESTNVEVATEEEVYGKEYTDSKEEIDSLPDIKDDEVLERGLDYTIFKDEDGQKVLKGYLTEIRYEDEDGTIKDYDNSLIPIKGSERKSESGKYAFQNAKSDIEVLLPMTLKGNDPIKLTRDGRSFEMRAILNEDVSKRKSKREGEAEDITKVVKKEKEDYYGQKDEKVSSVVYETERDEISYEYEPTSRGIKENIIIHDVPSTNTFSYKVKNENAYATLGNSGEIIFRDNETDEETYIIMAPNMHDSSEAEGYNETDLEYSLEEDPDIEEGYIVTLTIDRNYLDDEDREYPVIVDPTITHTHSNIATATVKSAHPNDVFKNSSLTQMYIGYSTPSKVCRAYMKFSDLMVNSFKGDHVTSGNIRLRDNGANAAPFADVYVRRITEAFNANTLTWNTRPTYAATVNYDHQVATGSGYKTFNLINLFTKFARGELTNYGIAFHASSENSSSVNVSLFHNEYASNEAYRPLITVKAVDLPNPPTAPTSLTVNKAHISTDASITVNWAGITTPELEKAEYRLYKYKTPEDFNSYDVVTDWTKVGTAASGSFALSTASLAAGCYSINLRGVDKGNKAGSPKGVIFHKDLTSPTLGSISISPASSSTSYKKEDATITYSNFIDTHRSKIEYKVNSGAFTALSKTTLDGSFVIPKTKFTTEGKHTITVRGVDAAGNVSAAKTIDYYCDNVPPALASVTISPSSSSSNWKNTPPLISYSGFTDLNKDRVEYSVNGGTVFTSLGSGESGNGTVPENSLSAKKNTISVRAKDKLGNIKTMTPLDYYYDKTPPTTKINSIIELGTGNHINSTNKTIRDTVTITTEVSDQPEASGVKTSNLKLKYSDGTEYTIYENQTAGKVQNLNVANLRPGICNLELNSEDKAGNKATASVEVIIENPPPKPTITAPNGQDGTEIAKLKYEFSNATYLDYVEYSIDGGTSWTTLPDSSSAEGDFNVPLSVSDETYCDIDVRGVDTSGIPGASQIYKWMIDNENPVVSISGFLQGVLSGSVTDTYFKKWTLHIKEESSDDSTYTKIGEGVNSVVDGEICFIDLADEEYISGNTYTVKLTAIDYIGNTTSDTYEVEKSSEGFDASQISPEFKVKRPYTQEGAGDSYILRSGIGSIELEPYAVNGTLPGYTYDWYLDNIKKGVGTYYDGGFDVITGNFQEDVPYSIFAIGKDDNGNRKYSRTITKNGEIGRIDFQGTADENNAYTETINLTKQAVSFRIIPSSILSATYEVKIGDSNFVSVQKNETIYVEDIKQYSAYANEIVVKVTYPSGITPEYIRYQADTLDKEEFKLSVLENYAPIELSVKAQVNYKTNIGWGNHIMSELPEGVSYEIYRSTNSKFDPEDTAVDTLITSDMKDRYFSELNVNYSESFYYRVRAVKKDENGVITEKSSFSEQMSSIVLDVDEYTKRMGTKEYWAYADFQTPNGNGSIEKSEGNLVYTQTDATLPNEKLPVDLTRTYNSRSSSKSSFGIGWNHNFDLALLRVSINDALNDDNIVYKDETGTFFHFVKDETNLPPAGGSPTAIEYTSSMGKYITLTKEDTVKEVQLPEGKIGIAIGSDPKKTVTLNSAYTMKTKDNIEYLFNIGGQLIYIGEPNGKFTILEYNSDTGLLSKVTTDKNLSMRFIYYSAEEGEDPCTVKAIEFPDLSRIEYGYEGNPSVENARLVSVTKSSGETDITYEYGYEEVNIDEIQEYFGVADYGQPNLNMIYDALGNAYQVIYDNHGIKAKEIIYPNGEKLSLTFGSNSTVTQKIVNGEIAFTETDEFEGTFGNRIQNTDPAGVISTYTYQDNLLLDSDREVDYQSVDNSGYVRTHQTTRSALTTYDTGENVASETDEDAAVTTYTYYTQADGEILEDLVKTETTIDALGSYISNITYTYDSFGNEIMSYDSVEKLTVQTEYYTEDSDGHLEGEVKKVTELYDESNTTPIVQTTYEYRYDNNGNKTEITTESSAGKSVESTVVYDVMGREISSTDNTGKTTTNTYDGFGRVVNTSTSETDSNNQSIDTYSSSTYNANGSLIGSSDHTGAATTYEFDNMNRVVLTTQSKGTDSKSWTTTYGYDDVNIHTGKGLLGTITVENALVTTNLNGDGEILSQTYTDALGRTVREKANGLYTDTIYNKQGNAITTYNSGANASASEGKLSLQIYNEAGNVTHTVINPTYDSGEGAFYTGGASIVNKTTYDNAGKVISEADGIGNLTAFGYNAKGELSSVTLPGNIVTSYLNEIRDSNGNLTDITTDANGNKGIVTTNARGEVKKIEDKDSQGSLSIATTFEYDIKSNKTKETFGEGNYKTFEYDGKDRLIATNYFDKLNVLKLRSEIQYDNADNMVLMKDYTVSGGTNTLYRYTKSEYDSFSRLVGYAEIDGSSVPTQAQIDDNIVQYEYDVDDNLTKVIYPESLSSGVKALRYEYNLNKLLSVIYAITSDNEYTLREYYYDNLGKVSQMKDYRNFMDANPSYILRTHTYDDFERPLTIVYTDSDDPNTNLESYSYTYDKNSQILTEALYNNYPQQNTDKVDEVRSYTYSNVGRLTSVNIQDNLTNTSSQTSYTYDAAGNRLTETKDGVVTANTYNGLNQQVTSLTGPSANPASSVQFVYDNNGNQISEADSILGTLNQMSYDPDNRLDSYISKTGNVTNFTQLNKYNGAGQRIKKTEGGSDINYYYNGGVLYTTDSQGNVTSLNLQGVSGNIIASERADNNAHTYSFYHKDLRESTTSIISSEGENILSYYYSVFGETEKRGNQNFFNEICYTGGIYDGSTKLYYLNARYYDPENARFISQDTYRGDKNDPSSLHLYAYCANNPINFTDPSGHKPKRAWSISRSKFSRTNGRYYTQKISTWAISSAVRVSVALNYARFRYNNATYGFIRSAEIKVLNTNSGFIYTSLYYNMQQGAVFDKVYNKDGKSSKKTVTVKAESTWKAIHFNNKTSNSQIGIVVDFNFKGRGKKYSLSAYCYLSGGNSYGREFELYLYNKKTKTMDPVRYVN